MAKKAKDETLDLFYLNKEQQIKNNKKIAKKQAAKKSAKAVAKKKSANKKQNKLKKTKDGKFDFDEEIIIGLKKVEEDLPKKASKQQKKKASNKASKAKSSKVAKKKNQPVMKQNMSEDDMYAPDVPNVHNQKRNSPRQNIPNMQNTHNIQNATRIKPGQNRNVHNSKQEKPLTPKQELAKKKRMAVLRVVKWTSLFAILVAGAIYALLSPIFNIKIINVSGNDKIWADEIISLSKINLEENMFSYRKSDIIANVKENAYIDTAEVHRQVPDTIEIVVTERKPSFMISVGNAYALINNQGYILEIVSANQGLPIIEGIETAQEDMQAGKRLCTEDLQKLGDVLKIMESATSNGLAELITKIDITDKDDYILTLEKSKKTVHLGDTSNLSTKMLYILKVNKLEGNTKGEIILNMNLNDERNKPYFRKEV